MGLEEVSKDILRKINSEINAIKKAGKKEVDSILNNAKEEVKKLRKARDLEVSRMSQNIKKKEEAYASLQAKKIELNVKKQVLEDVYAKVLDKIKNISGKEREGLLKELIKKAKQEIDAKYIYSNEQDKGIVKKLARGLTYGGTIDCIGGVVLETEDHLIGVDYTFESIFEQVKDKTLNEVSKKLFSIKRG